MNVKSPARHLIIDVYYSRYARLLVIGAFVLALFIHLTLTFSGFYNDDDVNYARHAASILNYGPGSTAATDHFALRWTTIYSAVITYFFLGVNDLASCLPSFIFICSTAFLLKKLTQESGNIVFFISITVFLLSRTVILNMHRLLPDACMCFLVLWMYYAYRSAHYGRKKEKGFALQFSAALFLAIITKETILIAIPFYVIVFIRDILKKQNRLFWKVVLMSSIVIMAAYLLYFKQTTGNSFYRFTLLEKGGYFNQCSYNLMPAVFTINRVAYELWEQMLLTGDMLLLIPAITACIYFKKIHDVSLKRMDIMIFLVFMVSANFMSISWNAYVPLCPASRHFIFILPFAALLSAYMIRNYLLQPHKFILLPVLMGFAWISCFFVQAGSIKILYLTFTILLIAIFIIRKRMRPAAIYILSCLALMGIFSLNYLADFIHPLYPYYYDQEIIVRDNIKNLKAPSVIYSGDPFSSELNEYFLEFKPSDNIFLPLDSAKPFTNDNVYLLINSAIKPKLKSYADSLGIKALPPTVLLSQHGEIYFYKVSNAFIQQLHP